MFSSKRNDFLYRNWIGVADTFLHPDFDAVEIEWDVALLRLDEIVDLSVHPPACLPKNGAKFNGKMGFVYGKNIIFIIKRESFHSSNKTD